MAFVDLTDKATLHSECEPGARAFFQAMPNRTLGLAVPAAEFVTEIKARLCIRERSSDVWCPLCDAVLDTRGHHSRMCCAGGDRTLRHNAFRNYVFKVAVTAGLRPELERPGLLLPALPEAPSSERRRPADVYLPSWITGSPCSIRFRGGCSGTPGDSL